MHEIYGPRVAAEAPAGQIEPDYLHAEPFAKLLVEHAVVAHGDAGQVRPAFAGPGGQALGRGGLCGVGVLRHENHLCCDGVSYRGFGALVRHKDQMPMSSPYVIVLSDAEEAVLSTRVRSGRSAYRDRLRAQIVLAAAAGRANARIAGELGVCADTVRKGRRRFAGGRLAGLKDARRSGRPPVFTGAARAEAVALACALPAESGVPLSKWSCPELARELATRCQVAASASTVRRWLADDAPKPWQHRSWISVRDPDFALKAGRVWTCTPGSGRRAAGRQRLCDLRR
jgi:transposase